jgi:hypothetical protein
MSKIIIVSILLFSHCSCNTQQKKNHQKQPYFFVSETDSLQILPVFVNLKKDLLTCNMSKKFYELALLNENKAIYNLRLAIVLTKINKIHGADSLIQISNYFHNIASKDIDTAIKKP